MDLLKPSLITLHEWFPKSFNIEVPPIYSEVLAGFQGISFKEIESNIKLTNEVINDIWDERTIGLYDEFTDPSTLGEEIPDRPIMFLLGDVVHFSDLGNNIRVKIINSAVVFFYLFFENPSEIALEESLEYIFEDLSGKDHDSALKIRVKHYYIHNKEEIKGFKDKLEKEAKSKKKPAKKKTKKKK